MPLPSEQGPRFAIWSIDWEDNHDCFFPEGRFAQASRRLHDWLAEITGGRMTWYAKIDFVSDITDHHGLESLAADIIRQGGEIGVHAHHFSWEPYWRERLLRRALRSLADHWGVMPASYSSGMGNYVCADTPMFMRLGFKDGRLVYPGYRHPQEAFFEKPYYGLAGMNLIKSTQGIRAGYLDPRDFARYVTRRTVLNFPQACLPNLRRSSGAEGSMLKLGLTEMETTRKIVAHVKARSRFIHAYCHPHNLLDARARLEGAAIRRVADLAALLKSEGYHFVTCAQARSQFEKYGEVAQAGKKTYVE
ncbi:MAG: hypothetical protein PHW60_04655 [Kiritimatiellae bacterium]|nr:hypothetical protein [Kiritimatiellia bacterium]